MCLPVVSGAPPVPAGPAQAHTEIIAATSSHGSSPALAGLAWLLVRRRRER